MKIIDLLNIWVEDRNKLPKKIKVDDETYIYDNQLDLYKIPKKDYFLISNYLNCVERLDIEVEVIEENKEIEELDNMELINARPEVNAIKINELILMMIDERDKQIDLLETENADLKKLLIEVLQEKKHLEKIIKELNSKRNGGTNE